MHKDMTLCFPPNKCSSYHSKLSFYCCIVCVVPYYIYSGLRCLNVDIRKCHSVHNLFTALQSSPCTLVAHVVKACDKQLRESKLFFSEETK